MQTVEALAARQSAVLEEVSQELLASPEIMRSASRVTVLHMLAACLRIAAEACPVLGRQGDMQKWVSGEGRWQDCHFVLTRSGFLHWLLSAGAGSCCGACCGRQAAGY